MRATDREGYRRAVERLRAARTPHGLLASTTDTANYRRIWARDGIICGLAGLVAEDDALLYGLHATLKTLADAQGPDGQIPSNVAPETGVVSYGGLAGRVDPSAWFVVGVCHLALAADRRAEAERLRPAMQRALRALAAWEINRRGLVYVPQGGDWADEYVLHGYVLYVQLVRLWALRVYAAAFDDTDAYGRAARLLETLRLNYWPCPDEADHPALYHPRAYRHFLDAHGPARCFLAALAPGGYSTCFDAWSNALAVLLGLPTTEERTRLLDYGAEIAGARPHGLVPAFWPPITEGDPEWPALQVNYSGRFRNAPGHYHNGGLWPVVNGWWGLALHAADRTKEARALLGSLHRFNRQDPEGDDWGFYEYADAEAGQPLGTRHCTWSAAGAVLLSAGLDGKTLCFGPAAS